MFSAVFYLHTATLRDEQITDKEIKLMNEGVKDRLLCESSKAKTQTRGKYNYTRDKGGVL